MTKLEWLEKLQKQGIKVYLENNVLMFKTDNLEEAKKYKKAIKDYPYSWGIKKIGGEEYDEGEILPDTEED